MQITIKPIELKMQTAERQIKTTTKLKTVSGQLLTLRMFA